ncbi:muconolactone Delta-isomerase [Sphingobium jiangsuense]|uniref:Muconolactone Delta-isomerase n=1 Tax=Sphingobium jiangsuense TaxID=870476 RepID=A0A7W6FQC6_9SPHN|nr:muconolactone Delta-isomerase [Sphingobium jiangsuense]MBB3926790.1 muconolactone D-isomerase [Sphingobium jiangsuense]GLT02494.1 muconolactone Delta-isomerase [Sphingobium jiangsuense]
MLFKVEMDVNVPPDVDPARFEQLKAAEKARFQELQRAGTWRHIWRVVGRYSNVSIFDVADNGELHDLLTGLPLYPFMDIRVTALCRHPSSIHEDDR